MSHVRSIYVLSGGEGGVGGGASGRRGEWEEEISLCYLKKLQDMKNTCHMLVILEVVHMLQSNLEWRK